MPSSPINCKKPSQSNELTTTFSNTLDALPPLEYVWELSSGITCEDYLAATFKWSKIINQSFKYATKEIQQYIEFVAEFEEQKHLHYQNIHQKVTLMVMPPENAGSSTDLWICPRCLQPTPVLPQRNHCLYPLLKEILLKFMPLFLTPKLMKYHKNSQ